MAPRSKQSPVVIIGAGVFGLSTSIHLAERGYSNITVLDKNPYDTTLYAYKNGCDAASADDNKIIRAAYGAEVIYQELSIEAMHSWKAWNSELESGVIVPPGMSPRQKLFVNNCNLQMTDKTTLPSFEKSSVGNMTRAGYGNAQVITDDPDGVARAEENGFGFAVDPFGRMKMGKPYLGLLDCFGGMAYADLTCRFALEKARLLGVKTILGGVEGTFDEFLYSRTTGRDIVGVITKDGRCHDAVLTIATCGGWTPALVPELDGICETTGGSVAFIDIPRDSSLWDRFAPTNFPTWTYKVRDGPQGGLYGFPRDENGVMKIGYRGIKFTNPKMQNDGKERSVPLTRWTSPESITRIPKMALDVIKGFMEEFLPELAENEIAISGTRMCWYTDSFDNNFVVDHVPGRKGLMVATGGSGHAFKFFPNIGKWVADVVEEKDLERETLKKWRWRTATECTVKNVLMEGSGGSRVLLKQEMYCDDDLKLRVRLPGSYL